MSCFSDSTPRPQIRSFFLAHKKEVLLLFGLKNRNFAMDGKIDFSLGKANGFALRMRKVKHLLPTLFLFTWPKDQELF